MKKVYDHFFERFIRFGENPAYLKHFTYSYGESINDKKQDFLDKFEPFLNIIFKNMYRDQYRFPDCGVIKDILRRDIK